MALSRINGSEELYVSGVFALRRAQALDERRITHILSVLDYSLDKVDELRGRYKHLSIDIDDDEDADLLMHFPRMVRFIEAGLYPDQQATAIGESDQGTTNHDKDDAITPAPPAGPRLGAAPEAACAGDGSTLPPPPSGKSPGAVLVHCAMGKSRSVTAVLAYLMWKHPARFGAAGRRNPDREAAARDAVAEALRWVRATREMAEPNDGFMRQLAIWWSMGRPASTDDAVERHPTYQRWLYKREVEESARIGKAPDWIRFEDEAEAEDDEDAERHLDGGRDDQSQHHFEGAGAARSGGSRGRGKGVEVRCKKCRRVLATGRFIIPHTQLRPTGYGAQAACPHIFIEPLSWMKPVLETGDLDGRLVCPGARCGASIGRYAWQGFRCSCDEWVCPAFSLQKSKVDEVVVANPSSLAARAKGSDRVSDPRAALGIRMPPSMRKENL